MLDCQTCGACCCNPAENRAEGYPWYVEIEDRGNRLVKDPGLRRRYVVDDPDGVPHMRLTTDDPRCVALEGTVGRKVRCGVYAHRPTPCRRLQAGSAACLEARLERGIDHLPPREG
ncbi:MAG: YkgJ family cysteine cluster protein [Alphaproteobacteria bacterium]|nr:YkgJ family cysteine cluster protein [Alphaproteobacteria bacterium]